jgi:hypothetical protein
MKLSRILFRVRVSGESMWPGLVPGRHYWASGLLKPRVGDTVVAEHPREPGTFVVKKVTVLNGERNGRKADRQVSLDGTMPWSSSFVVAADSIAGVLLERIIFEVFYLYPPRSLWSRLFSSRLK